MAQGKPVAGRRSCVLYIVVLAALILIIVGIALVLVVLPEQDRQRQAERHYQAGIAFQTTGDLDKAKSEYEQVITLDASYKDVQTRLADVQEQRKAYHYQRGLDYMNTGQYAEAVEEFKIVMGLDTRYKDVQAKLKEAEAKLAEVRTLTPTAVPVPTTTDTPTPTQTPTPTATPTPASGNICVLAYHDRNGNRTRDPDEDLLPGAMFTVSDGRQTIISYITDGINEPFCFMDLKPGNYFVHEENPPAYNSTTGDDWGVVLCGGATIRIDFGDKLQPTPVPTATPLPMHTPVPTPTPEPALLFFDDFDAGPKPDWEVLSGKWGMAQGKYTLTDISGSPVSGVSVVGDAEWHDYTVEADVSGLAHGSWEGSGDDGMAAILVRIQDDGRAVGLMVDRDFLDWEILEGDSWSVVSNTRVGGYGEAGAHIKVEVKGNVYAAHVDGKMITSFSDDRFASGKVGLWLKSSHDASGGSTVPKMDNFKVTKLD